MHYEVSPETDKQGRKQDGAVQYAAGESTRGKIQDNRSRMIAQQAHIPYFMIISDV